MIKLKYYSILWKKEIHTPAHIQYVKAINAEQALDKVLPDPTYYYRIVVEEMKGKFQKIIINCQLKNEGK